jgi:hypothetical protein
MILQDIYDKFPLLHENCTILEMIILCNRNDIEFNRIIYIPERTARYVIDCSFVVMSTVKCKDDTLIYDGGANSTLTRLFEDCTQIQPKVVTIQTASGSMSRSTEHICLKTYFVQDQTCEVLPIGVKAFIVLHQDMTCISQSNQQRSVSCHSRRSLPALLLNQ